MVDFFRVLKSSAAGRASAIFAKAKSLFKAAPKAVVAGAVLYCRGGGFFGVPSVYRNGKNAAGEHKNRI